MSECFCFFDEPFDPELCFSWLQEERRISKVERQCCECRGVINSGQPYIKTVAKLQGRLETYVTCPGCAELRKHFCGLYEGLYIDLDEVKDDLALTDLEGLTSDAVAKLEERYGEEWAELARIEEEEEAE